jgi:RNA-directed DNA polymerase
MRSAVATITIVRKVEIPKPGGGKRMLGIPAVTDPLIQQALLQVLTPIFDQTFSNWSFGFRPKRSAQEVLSWWRLHIAAGCRLRAMTGAVNMLLRSSI